MTKRESTVEVAESLLCEYVPGWGESNMELLEKAEASLCDLAGMLDAIAFLSSTGGSTSSYIKIARAALSDAKERIQLCHNELDVDRENAEIAQQ